MRPGLAHANGRFVRALQARLGLADWAQAAWALLPEADSRAPDPASSPLVVIESFTEEPWASLTFSGTRHALELRLEGTAEAVDAAAETLAGWADEADPLPGRHFLAEVQVTETAREIGGNGRMLLGLRLDALSIEE